MANAPYYTKTQVDAKIDPLKVGIENFEQDINEINQDVSILQLEVDGIADGTGGKGYANTSEAMAVTPLPSDGTLFTIDYDNEAERGVYRYDSTVIPKGYVFVRGFYDEEVRHALRIIPDAGLVIGSIGNSTGENANSTTRIRTNNYLEDVKNIKINTSDIFLYYAHYYLNGEYVSSVQLLDISEYTPVYPEGTNEMRFVLRRTDNSVITESDLENLSYEISVEGIIDVSEELKKYSGADIMKDDYNNVSINYNSSDMEYGGMNSSNGENASFNTIRIRSANHIQLEEGKDYLYSGTPSGFTLLRLYRYKDNIFVNSSTTITDNVISVDSTFNQVRFAFSKTVNTEEITPEELASFTFYLTTNEQGELLQKYIPKIPELEKKINQFNQETGFSGLKMASLGDSITYGFIPRNSAGYPGQLNSFAKLTAENLGMSFVNHGISGSTLGAITIGTETRNPFVYRYSDLPNDADIITVMGGTNDIRNNIPLGEFNDTEETSYYGALHVLCLGLLEKYRIDLGTEDGSKKIIVFLTPIKMGTDINQVFNGHTLEDYANAVKEVCAYYSIPVFDAYNLSGITPHILRTIEGTEPGYTDFYNPYITDAVHPTQDGSVMFANAFTGFLRTLK